MTATKTPRRKTANVAGASADGAADALGATRSRSRPAARKPTTGGVATKAVVKRARSTVAKRDDTAPKQKPSKIAARPGTHRIPQPGSAPTGSSIAGRAVAGTTGIIRTVAGISTAAVTKATGHGWAYWLKALDKAGAAALPHGEIARLISKTLGLKNPWWVQMIAVAYEQARGLRQPRERKDGFAATVSRTIAVPINALYAAWEEGRRGDWLPDGIEVSRKQKNKSMKITWPDGSGIDVNFYDKGGNKTVVAVEQTALPDPGAVDAVKEVWGAALDRLKSTLEGKR